MWMVCGQPARLTYAKGRLFKAGVSALARRILEHDEPDVGVPPFDQWGSSRQLACLAIVAQGLLSPGRPTTYGSLWTDAAVAATLKHVEAAVEQRTHFGPDLAVPWRQLMQKAYLQHHRRNTYWKRAKTPARFTARTLRDLWTTLDWQWIDTTQKEARDRWREQGYEILMQNEFAQALPNSYYYNPPPDPSTSETQEHEAYLLGLASPGRARQSIVSETLVMEQPLVRAQRRVQL